MNDLAEIGISIGLPILLIMVVGWIVLTRERRTGKKSNLRFLVYLISALGMGAPVEFPEDEPKK